MRKILIVIALILFAVILVIVFKSTQHEPETGVVIELTITTQEIKEESIEDNYIIETSFPRIGVIGNEQVNESLKQIVTSSIDGFKTQVAEWADPELDVPGQNGLWMWYETVMLNKDTLSIKFFKSDFFAGAAHPNHYTASFNYDLQNNIELENVDLINFNDKEYIEYLDSLIRTKLQQKFDEMDVVGFLDQTDTVISENSTINISPDGLIFSFDPYEVASYAAGGFDILVTTEELNN